MVFDLTMEECVRLTQRLSKAIAEKQTAEIEELVQGLLASEDKGKIRV